ncbi:MAG: aldehyde dehydrogenase family protein, partial [Pseudohongiellaceae bacterium]
MHLNDANLLRQQAWLDGAWVDADDGASLEVTNPATGVQLATIPSMGAIETRRAIEAAVRASEAWKSRTAEDRSRILRRWYELMLQHQDDLAMLMTSEQGK